METSEKVGRREILSFYPNRSTDQYINNTLTQEYALYYIFKIIFLYLIIGILIQITYYLIIYIFIYIYIFNFSYIPNIYEQLIIFHILF